MSEAEPAPFLIDGVLVQPTPEQVASLPKGQPKLDPTDSTFKEQNPWPSLTA
jgi:hypothetical protein